MSRQAIKTKLEEVDRQILELLNERCRWALKEIKQKRREKLAASDPEEIQSHLDALKSLNEGPLKDDSLEAVFREIISSGLALEHPLTVAFLGPEATFTHQAAIGTFGHSAKYDAKHSIADVFADVETERADFGCVPIENSTEGTVNHTLDMFINSSVKISAELNLRIHHNLMARCGFGKIRKVYSHAQVFGQCRAWLQEHLNGVELIETGSTTKAAELAVKEKDSAAIASSLAAELYDLTILNEHIEDHVANTTRFLIIGTQTSAITGNDKSSICFAIKDKVGALYECLLPFKEEEITLTMIESRPSKRKNWEYIFYVDLLGHISEGHIDRALGKLEEHCQYVKILGSYPRSTKINSM